MKVIDEFNNTHYIKDELGRGGQGVVYSTKDGDVVIKEALENNEIIKDTNKIKIFHNKINNIIYKPLPLDIKIAKPVALLKDRAGYIMKMLSGMKSLKELIPQELGKEKSKNIQIPLFLREFENQDKRGAIFLAYYLQTGGIRKRLEVLINVAKTLYRLHLNGFVYFDISYNNIFYRDDDNEVYFIDIDNLKYNSSIKMQDAILTPNFEVPEVANSKEPNSFYSDIYAFAILAFYMLTIHHPFDGNGVEESDWADESDTKNRWDLEWIYSNSGENEATPLMPKELSLTDGLFELFKKTFESKNKKDRPALNLWIKELNKANFLIIKCNNCNSTYYNKFNECPFCQSKKPKRVVFYQDNSEVFVREIDKEIIIPNFLFKGKSLKDNEPILIIKFIKERIELKFNNIENILINDKKIYSYRKKYGISQIMSGINITINNKNFLLKVKE